MGIKYLILVVIVSFSTTAASKDKSLCTFTQTYLKPGRGNVCMAKVVSGAKFQKDKILLQKIAARWNPPEDLSIKAIPGGYQLFRGQKLISEAAWIAYSKPILYWNGSIRTLPRAEASIGETIDKLLASPKKTAWFEFLPRAIAADLSEASLERDFLTLFTAREMDLVHGKEAMARPGFRFPQTSGLSEAWYGRDLQCGPHGVENMTVRLTIRGIEREVRFRSIGKGEWIVNGYLENGDQPSEQGVRISYEAKPSKEWSCSERTGTINRYDKSICMPLWEKYFDEHPAGKSEYDRNKMALWCGGFSQTNRDSCRAFFDRHDIDVSVYPLPDMTGKDSKDGNPSITAFMCIDADCKDTRQINDERDGLSEFEDAVAGAAVLGECCKSEPCRAEASSRLKLNLKPASAAGAIQ